MLNVRDLLYLKHYNNLMFILKSKGSSIRFAKTYTYMSLHNNDTLKPSSENFNLNDKLKALNKDLDMKTIYSNFNLPKGFCDNLKIEPLCDDLKIKTGNLLDASLDTTLINMLKVVKITEQKIIMEKLDNVEISASIMLGPVSMSITKKILLE